MKKIVSMTTMCVDRFAKTGELKPGGEALNFAVRASRCPDIETHLIGGIGDDEYGNALMSFLKKQHIDISCVHQIAGAVTANNVIYTSEAGDRYFHEDSWTGGIDDEYHITAEDEKIILESDLVYTTCYSINLPKLRELRKRGGFLLAVDFDVTRDFEKLKQQAKCVDILMLSGTEELLEPFKLWSEKSEIIFNITLAEKGSVTYLRGREYRVNAVPVERVVDTTGCGDSYHAAFLCNYLLHGDIALAMEEGSKAAAVTLQEFGGASEK